MPLLQVKGLVKYYGRRCVVNGVEFEVNTGEVVGLLGPNGAGKTTSFKSATGQIDPTEGKVWFNGDDVTGMPMYQRARLGMGYLSQEPSIFRKLTVEQNILAIMELMPRLRSLGRTLSRRERYERIDAVIHRFGLTKVRKSVAARLSGGEKRRLEIARCLVCEPLLILLDEPFTGIDPITIAEIRQIILELRNEGIGILLTDHNVHEALKITTRSYLIKEGKVRTHGTPAQIVRDPIAITEYLGQGFSDTSYRDDNIPQIIPQSEPAATAPTAAAAPAKPTPKPAAKGEAQTLDFPTSPGRSNLTPAQMILEQEKIQRLVEALKGSDHARAAQELVQKGAAAMAPLLTALERRDAELRQRAADVLQRILKHAIPFDPFAPESTRKQQLAALREVFERKAG
jgi:lipopolysaccharide export system ATP-binding protein